LGGEQGDRWPVGPGQPENECGGPNNQQQRCNSQDQGGALGCLLPLTVGLDHILGRFFFAHLLSIYCLAGRQNENF
jgi:hypothetical protein